MADVIDLRPALARRRLRREQSARRGQKKVNGIQLVELDQLSDSYRQLLAFPWITASLIFGMWTGFYVAGAGYFLGYPMSLPASAPPRRHAHHDID